ncbi:MAG: arginine deiminase [Bacteroidetes bacterium]|nr:arginine deiminase [Bacteroidota bacterium]
MSAEKLNYKVNVNSEVGELEAVILHTMGTEVENMTPENAERALYSDILNLSVARMEFDQLKGVLEKVTKVFEVEDLLGEVLKNDKVKSGLIEKVCSCCDDPHLREYLKELNTEDLALALIEGVPMSRDSLTRFLNEQRFALRPLHNFFFTRDASISIGNKVLAAKMASQVRERESQIMEAIFDYYPAFDTQTITADRRDRNYRHISIEGGDVLVARNDLTLIGIGARTTPQGVDLIVDKLKKQKEKHHILVQELPTGRESFIHLDMVFTFLSQEECMVYEPVVLQPNRFKTIHITLDNGHVKIREEKNILESLSQLKMDLKPLYCGGQDDLWTQEREQWHSGANFFAFAPGKVIGYGRNVKTIEQLSFNGYEIIEAQDIIENRKQVKDYTKCAITIAGSELSRGGGGARCMTMPVRRKEIKW